MSFKLGVPGRSSSRRSAKVGEPSTSRATSQFQSDVTFTDCDDSVINGPRSLGGMSPSTRGHTMKECEEQLSHLHKENFNLKLRIYFLEERLGHRGPPIPGMDAVVADVELLRSELAEKQQLLCQAATAIDLVEKKHQEEVELLHLEKQGLEGQLVQLQKISSQRCTEFQNEIMRLDDQYQQHQEEMSSMLQHCQQQQEEMSLLTAQCQQQADQLEASRQRVELVSMCTQCQEPSAGDGACQAPQCRQQVLKLAGLEGQCNELRSSLRQQSDRVDELAHDLQVKVQCVAEAEGRIKELEEALCQKEPEIQIKVQELRVRDNIIEEKQSQIDQQNRVLVEIQITLAEKQKLIDALNSTIAARDVKIAQLEAHLSQVRDASKVIEDKLREDSHDLNRAKGENEMLKAQLKRMNRSKEERESPRRRCNIQTRDMSPRNKSLIEEAVEGIWNGSNVKVKDDHSLLEEKENKWKPNDAREKSNEKSQPFIDYENKTERKSDTKFSEENYLKLEKEHQKGCEAIQGFISRIKHLAYENDHIKRDSKKKEKKLLELKLELEELRDLYNKAKWEARQFEADATGVPGTAGTLADVKDMTEEENERLWAEIEDKNKKLAQMSLEMEKQVQALLSSLKEKEVQLAICEKNLATSVGDLGLRDNRITELEKKIYELQTQIISLPNSKPSKEIANVSRSLAVELESSKNVIDHLEIGLKHCVLDLHAILDTQMWDKSTIDNLQESLGTIFKRKESEILAVQHQVLLKDLQLKMFQDKVAELGINISMPTSLPQGYVPVNISQHFQLQQSNPVDGDSSKVSSDLLTLQRQLSMSLNEQNYLHRKVEDLQKQVRNAPEQDSECRAVATLTSKCNKMKEDACASEVWKKEATKACNLLVGRLEELSEFLVSLLQHPEQLGDLEVRHCKFIKQAVQRSVNLSRQLSMSISHQDENDCTGQVSDAFPLQPASDINFSLVGRYLEVDDDPSNKLGDLPFESCSTSTLDNVCGFNISEVGNRETALLASGSLQNKNIVVEQAMVITRLRSQIETLKFEVKQRDIELHCFMQEHNLLQNSSPLGESQVNAEDHSLESMTFYNKNLTARNPLIPAVRVGNGRPTETQAFGMHGDCDENDDFAHLTDHIQIDNLTLKSGNLFTKSQSLNKSINSGEVDKLTKLGICEKPVVSHAQQDALALSESETWSEPDRQISLARIGLPEESTCLASSSSAIFRHHYSRSLQEMEESSESSQETAREIIRTPGKRRSDALDLRRLQARLRGLEQVNEVLKTEVNILHQLTPVSNHSLCTPSPTGVVNNETSLTVMSTSNQTLSDEKSPSNTEQIGSSVMIPSYLLEQIKYQREKLESSLFHNDFIRRQLEDVFFSATGAKPDEKKVFPRIKTTSEHSQEAQNKAQMIEAHLEETEAKVKQLEIKLHEAERLLAETREQSTRVAEAEKLCGEAHDTISSLHDQVQSLGLQLEKKDAEILEKESLVADLESQVLMQKIEIDKIIKEMSDLKLESEKKVIEAEGKLKEVENTFLGKIKELESGLLTIEKVKACAEGELLDAKNKLKEAELQREEANAIIEMMKVEFASKLLKSEEAQTRLEGEIEKRKEESNQELDRRSKKLEEAEKQLNELRWVYKAEVEKKVKDAERLGSDVEAGLRKQIEIVEKKSKDAEELSKAREADLRKKVQESEKRFLDQVMALRQQQDDAMLAASQASLERTRLSNEKLRVEQELRQHETKESELMEEHREAEGQLLAIQERLNQQIVILERKKCELERRVQDLELANADLKFHIDRLSVRTESPYRPPYSSRRAASPPLFPRSDGGMFTRENSYLPGRGWGSEGRTRSPDTGRSALSNLVLQHGFGRQHSDFSDYMSEDQEFETIVTQSCSSSYWITTVSGTRAEACSETQQARNINSPDLGIESDQGRFSSLEANAGTFPQDYTSTRQHQITDLNDSSAALQTFRGEHDEHNCTEMKEINFALKRELCQTRRALKETLAQLTASNQRKQNADKAICRQLQKTQHILKKTRGNLQPDHLMLCDDQT